jgi:DNA repair protein RecN (Recombination protein N)
MARMIESLRISNLGVIADAAVELDRGLTVLTGETGAGKTMVLTALGLILGSRAEPALVRSGAEGCAVEAAFRVIETDAVRHQLDDMGAAVDEDGDDLTVLAVRTVTSQGKNRAVLGGRSVPAASLRAFTEQQVVVHGQADQWRLRRSTEQRAILDGFAGLDQALASYREAFVAWQASRAELAALLNDAQEAERAGRERAEGLAAIAAVEPQPGEDAELDAVAAALSHAVAILQDTSVTHDALMGNDDDVVAVDAMNATVQALRAVERIAAIDPRVSAVHAAIRAAQDAVQEATAQLQAYANDIDADPGRLQSVEERRRSLADLKRRYGPTLDDVLAWRQAAEAAGATDVGARIAALGRQIEEQSDRVRRCAGEITLQRTEAAQRLSAAVTGELATLAMTGAAFEIAIDSTDDIEAFTETGADQVEFRLAAHHGGAARPIAKGASGGELARVMLALEVVVAGSSDMPTFVFDEVDAGVGGRAAVEVGNRLAKLAERAQVLVVTHLPQVAAFADTHVVVDKTTTGAVTSSDVRIVDGEERITELVRMLSGLPESETGADHARELLAAARAARVADGRPNKR